MTYRPFSYIPPLAISRMIGSYHFEGSGYVALVADGDVSAELIIEKAQALLDLKRQEIADRAASGMEARQGGNEVPSRSDDSPAPQGDAQETQP